MTQEERIKKYNPYTTKNNKISKKLYDVFFNTFNENDLHDFLCSSSYIEYERYVSDCIDLNIVPIKYNNWIDEQAKFNYIKNK